VQAVSSIPVLSVERERDLAEDLYYNENLQAARELVMSHLRFVVHIAKSYSGYGLAEADLIQEGNVGLMKAVKRFDPERGVRLVSFAVHWIKAEMHEFIMRNWRLVKIATTKQQRKLFFNLRSMKKGLATLSPTEVDAVAEKLGVKPAEVVEMETRFGGRDISLDPLTDEDDDSSYSPSTYLTDGAEPLQELEAKQNKRLRGESLELSLANLDDRSRHIIKSRWLREKDTATLHDLADELGVSAERVRQIEAKAIQKMRGIMVPAT
jgi:RNA polymerase sigma-32 factor